MRARGRNHRKSDRRRAGKPPRWLVFSALAASTTLGGRAATMAHASQGEGGAPSRERVIEALPARRLELPLGFEEPSLLAWLDAAWSERLVPGETVEPGLEKTALAAADTPALRFDIPPGPLSAALAAFEEKTGVTVEVADEAIRGLGSPGVSGLFTREQALRELLAGTGVAYRFLDGETVRLELGEIAETLVVTAPAAPSSPKYTQPLRDTPQTLTVIPQSLIVEQGATTLRDVLRNVSGISIQAGEGGGGLPGDNLAIRGFAARNDIFVDGVRDFGAYTRDTYNIEQVEVTKGPSSLYAGRGSTGGALNLTSKTPSLAAAETGTLAAGTEAYGRATIDVNQPVPGFGIPGTAVRVNAMWNDAETPGRDAVENQRWGIAPSIAFGLGTPTRVTLAYSHLDQDNVPDYGIPWVPPTNVPLAEYADKPAPVSFDNFYGLTDRDYEKTVTRIATGELVRDLGEALTLRSLLRHGESSRDSIITAPRFASPDSTAINRQLQSRDLEDTILALQNDLTAHATIGGIDHALVAGMELAREDSENHARTGPTAPQADLFDPDPETPYTGAITRTGARTESTADTAAVYVADTVKLDERWQLTGGLRWDRFDIDFLSVATDGVATPFARTDEMVSWRAGVVHKPRPNGSVYAAFGTSFNPSAEGNTGLALTASTVDLAPEESRGYELGTKWDFPARAMSLNAAVFRNEKTNARTPGLTPDDPPIVLQGEQRVDGLELGFSGNLTDRWSAFAGYTYLASEVLRSNTPAEVDNEIANTPEHSASLWTTYRLRPAFELGGGAQYVGDRFNNNTATRSAPDYLLFDAMAAYDVNERLTLRLHVNNLTDERYIDRVGGGHFIPGAGRSVSLTTDVDF